ncbi:hypothetical protein HYZ97_00450 [Candidatus Pacearchaeota archaeon]|nr:hypothetical protein [Candidatus Pacearchaeota archaeon]
MSYGIWYRSKLIGSVHYLVYKEGKLPGREQDIFLRMNDLCALETLLKLSSRSSLRIGGNDKGHEMRYAEFKEEILAKVRDIHIENNSIGASVHG